MDYLAHTIMRGPLAAILVTSLAAIAGLLLPPLGYLSAAAVGLITLRLGIRQGGKVVAGAALITLAPALLLLGSPGLPLFFLAMLWLPLLVTAGSLRRTAHLGRTLLLPALFGLMVVAGLHWALDDPVSWWNTHLGQIIEQRAAAEQRALLEPVLADMAAVMTGVLGAVMTLGLIISLLLARWWQARLYNPGGFRQEFHSLRLGRSTGIATLVLLVPVWLQGAALGWLADFLPVLLVLMLLQGLAVIHALAARRGLRVGWLVALYVLLLFPVLSMQAGLLVALLGLMDSWMDFRARGGADTTNR